VIETSQYVYAAVLLVGSIVAFSTGSRAIIVVMLANFIGTVLYSYDPFVLAVIDFFSAWVLLLLVEDDAAKTVAFIFLVMVFTYPIVELVGFYTLYSIIDGMAYVQIFAMGGDGFGRLIRSIIHRLRSRDADAVHIQESRLDAAPHDQVAVAKDSRR